jgi:hypothetical protein
MDSQVQDEKDWPSKNTNDVATCNENKITHSPSTTKYPPAMASYQAKVLFRPVKSKNQLDVVGLKNAAKSLQSSNQPRRREFLDSASQAHFHIRSISSRDPYPERMKSVEDQEEFVRAFQITNPFILTALGFYSAFKVMFLYLINLETVLSCCLTVVLTLYWYHYGQTHDGWQGGGMDYVLLAFSVTSPIAAAIGMAYNRREMALMYIADFRSFSSQLYIAHSVWDWNENGGREGSNIDLRAHSDAVLAQIVGIGDELARFLTLPTASRSIHRMTRIGKREAAHTVQVAYRLLESMSHRFTRLSVYGERIKEAGLPSGEISRIRQYERFMEVGVERLRMIKMYRTPQAFRSFARIFTFALPPFYAPSYAQVGIDLQSLGMGISFGLVTALGLTALFESLQVLEDPFVGFLALDGIDVREEFQVLLWAHLVSKRKEIFPDAPPYPINRRRALADGRHVLEESQASNYQPGNLLLSPSILSLGSSHRQKLHNEFFSSPASSLTGGMGGKESRSNTAHDTNMGQTEDKQKENEQEGEHRILEGLEFGHLFDDNLDNSALGADSTIVSGVRESNFKIHDLSLQQRGGTSLLGLNNSFTFLGSSAHPRHRRSKTDP